MIRRIADWLRSRLKAVRLWWVSVRAPGRFLCDSCRYDYGDVCQRPERPNATRCEDYRPR